MFEKIEEKLQCVAWVWLIAGMLMSLIGCVIIISNDKDSFFIGIIVLTFGILSTLTISFLLWGFSELLERNQKIIEQTKKSVKAKNNDEKETSDSQNIINKSKEIQNSECLDKAIEDNDIYSEIDIVK